MSNKTVVFDFDGVIHSYTSGWKGDTVIPDPPVPGIKEAIADIMEDYLVVVVSTRCATEEGKAAIEAWLHKYGIEVDEVTKEKPPAICYIDDRAICFDGRPELLRSKIEAFKPWYQAKKDIEEQVCDLSEFLFHYPVTYNTFWEEDCKRLAHILCSSGYSKQSEGEWISVEDRLPEKHQVILAYRGYFTGDRMNTYTYLGSGNWEDDYGYRGTAEHEGITHWKPLPEPPKMKGGSK